MSLRNLLCDMHLIGPVQLATYKGVGGGGHSEGLTLKDEREGGVTKHQDSSSRSQGSSIVARGNVVLVDWGPLF